MRRSTIVAGALAAGLSLGMPVAAVAQDYVTTNDPPRVRGTTETRTEGDTKVAGVTTSRGSLAVTGGDIVGLVAMGAGAIGVGTVLVRRGRTRSSATA